MKTSLFAFVRRAALLGLASVALLACGATSTPRVRVARDLGCSADDTRVERVEPGPRPGQTLERWRVSGCGKSAVYLCTVPVRDCWREGEKQTLAVDP